MVAFALMLIAGPSDAGLFVADTLAGVVQGRGPVIAADGTLRLGPTTLPTGSWRTLRRARTPLPAWPGGPQVILNSGDRLAGRIVGGDARAVQFVPAFAPKMDPPWALPLTLVATVWVTPPPTESESERVQPPWARPKVDTLQSTVGQVPGRLLGFRTTPPGIRFRPQGAAPLELPLREVRALVLDPTIARPVKLRAAALRAVLRDGSRLTFTTWALAGEVLSGRTAFGIEVQVGTQEVVALDLVGQAGDLSQLTPEARADGYTGVASPWRANRSAQGGALKLHEFSGVSTYDAGFGVPARTRLSFDLPADAGAFTARVGVDPTQPRPGPVRVGLELDGKPLPGGGVVRPFDEPLRLRAELAGGKRLTLVTDFVGGGVGATANWVETRVSPASGPPQIRPAAPATGRPGRP